METHRNIQQGRRSILENGDDQEVVREVEREVSAAKTKQPTAERVSERARRTTLRPDISKDTASVQRVRAQTKA